MPDYGTRAIINSVTGKVTREPVTVNPDQRTPDQIKDEANEPILTQIKELEISTLRALRDNARGNGNVPDGQGSTPNQRLDNIETEITALRDTLQ